MEDPASDVEAESAAPAHPGLQDSAALPHVVKAREKKTKRQKKKKNLSISRKIKSPADELRRRCRKNPDQMNAIPSMMGSRVWVYGVIVGGNSKGWEVKYNILPLHCNIVDCIKNGNGNLVGLADDEEEVVWDDPGQSPFELQQARLLEYDTVQDPGELPAAEDLLGAMPGAAQGTVPSPDSVDADIVMVGPAEPGPPGIVPPSPPPVPAAAAKPPKRSEKQSARDFVPLGVDGMLAATECDIHWHNKSQEESVQWKILGANEHITTDEMIAPHRAVINPELNVTKPLADNFFEHILFDIKGVAMKMHRYLNNPKATYHKTYQQCLARSHSIVNCSWESEDDPEKHVKQFIKMLIAASSEVKVGVEGLYTSKRKTHGRREPPNFAKYMNRKMFECMRPCFCYMYADEKYWFLENKNVPWEVFMPCLQSMNAKRQKIFVDLVMALYDESMSGWCPKTSKYGGLPNYTYEPRKPVPLGAMLRNCACPQTGVMLYQDIVIMPEEQRRKDYGGDTTVLPSQQVRPQPTAEVLRQAQFAGVKGGGWVGGDAWFGSVTSAVETLFLLGIFSTWIVKKYTHLFPVTQLFELLMARYSNTPGGIAGKWVVMTADIPCTAADDPRKPGTTIPAKTIRVIAMAYAWSKRGVSYFVSTCGLTTVCKDPYNSHYEDEYGCVGTRQLPRPWLADFLFKKLPIIDEHNKQRQKILALEKCWPTKNCYTRLIITLLGQCVVDFFYTMQYLLPEVYDEMDVREFADELVGRLPEVPSWEDPIDVPDSTVELVRNGKRKAEGKGRATPGLAKRQNLTQQMTCWVCRKYVGGKKVPQTSYRCGGCGIPVCRQVRPHGPHGRLACSMGHKHVPAEDVVGCRKGRGYTHEKFPLAGRHETWERLI